MNPSGFILPGFRRDPASCICRLLLKPVVLAFLLGCIPAVLHSQSHFAKAEEYEKAGEYRRAEEYYLLAEANAPANGYITARLAQLYYRKLQDTGKALPAYEAAYSKGFAMSWLFLQAAAVCREVQLPAQARTWYERGITALSSSLHGTDHAKRLDEYLGLHGSYVEFLLDSDAIDEAWLAGMQAYEQYGAVLNHSLSYALGRVLYWKSVLAFGSGHSRTAFEAIDLACTLISGNQELYKKWHDYYSQLRELYRKSLTLTNGIPEKIHRIVFVVIPRTRASYFTGGGSDLLQGDSTALEQSRLALSTRFLQGVYNTCSQGRLGLSIDIVLSDLELKQVSLYREYDTPATRYFHPDLDALLPEYEDYLYPYLMEYDTVVLVWNPGVRNMANAGERIFTLPGRNLQLKRGYMQIPAERIISEGPFLLPHEFFHVIEKLAGIGIIHGYHDENRQHFPGWKGKGELDYYCWLLSAPLKDSTSVP